jgi:hypothetical protein
VGIINHPDLPGSPQTSGHLVANIASHQFCGLHATALAIYEHDNLSGLRA